MAQDPQAYVDDQGNEYIRDGNRWRVIRPGSQAAPLASPTSIPGLIPMETPAQRAQAEERAYDRQRDEVRDARLDRTEERQATAAERAARNEERQIEQASRAGTPESRGRLATAIGPSVLAQDSLARQEVGANGQGVNPLNRDWGAAMLDAVPDLGVLSPVARAWGGQDYQDYNQSLKTVEASLLPVFSGMAVTPQEAQRFIRANQPQVGDSPDTLERKARNRQTILNEAAAMLGREMPYPGIGVYGDEGFRDRASQDGPARAQGVGIRPGNPVTPEIAARFGQDGQITSEEMLAAGWSPDRESGLWLPPGGAAGGSPPPDGPQGGGSSGGGIADPIAGRDDADRAADLRSDQGEGLGRKVDAAGRGFADMVTFGLADEIAAGANTILPLDRGSESIWSMPAGEAYRHNLAMQRGIDQADAEDVPVSRGAGQVAGGLAFVPRAAAGLAGRSLLANSVRGAGAGAAYGGAYGFGSAEGSAIERAPEAGQGALIGAAAGGAAPSVVNVGGRVLSPVVNALADGGKAVARPVVNALGDMTPEGLRSAVAPNPLARGLDRFAGTNRPNVNALTSTREQLEGAVGRPVAAANLVNTGGRAMLRGVATRSDGAREIAENFGQGTAEALPSRVGQQGRRILSSDTRPPDEIRAALRAERDGLAREQYAEPYAQPVQIADDLAGALSGAPGRAAIQRARAAAEAWQDTAVMAELDALEAAARAGQPPPQVSAGAVDRIRQAMSGRGERLAQNPATRAIGAGVQNRAGQVDEALEGVEGLAPARAAYREGSRQIEAVDAGERFMGNAPDEVAAAMRGAPDSAQAPFRAAAARSIERAAGSTGAAPGVANRLAIGGTPQRQMMDETLGAADAERLATAMRGERDIYRGALQVDPGVGSQTTNNSLKAAEAAGGMIGDLAQGRPLGVVRRAIGLLDSRGFNQQEAEAVLQAMTDPNRTDEVIGMLAERMSRREARRLTRALRYQLTIAPQSGQQN